MARKAKQIKKRKLEQYDHKGKKRVNNPPVGLVNPETDKDAPKKNYKYDPHLDPRLEWCGTISLPFSSGEYKQCAVKIIDDRGIESLRIIRLGE